MISYKLNMAAINEIKKIYSEPFRLLEENKYREAEALFVWGLKKRPADKCLSLGLARCYSALKKNEDAGRVFEWLRAERFESAYKYYGYHLDEQGQTDKAIVVLEEFARYCPYNAEAYRMLCHSYEKKGEYQKAMDVINEGIILNPNKGSLIEKKAQIMENRCQYSSAIELLEWATESKYKKNLTLQLSLGHCYEKNDQPDRAIEHFKRVISKFPQEDSPKKALINLYLKLKMVDSAHAIFPNLKESYTNQVIYGLFLGRTGQWNEAIKLVDVLIDQEPTRIDAYLAKAKILSDSNMYDYAIEFYNYTKSKFPQNAGEIDLKQGYCELNRGNLKEAEECFKRLEALPEFKLDLLEARAYLLHDQESYASALSIVQQLKQVYFETKNEHRLRLVNRLASKIHRKMKCYDKALEEHNYNLSHLKGDISDQYWLAMIYQEKGELDNSISIVSNLIQKYPHYKEARLLFAILLEGKRDYAAAEKAFLEIFQEFPNYKEARLSYTVFLKTVGRYQDEISEFLQIKRYFPDYKEAGLTYVWRLAEMGHMTDALKEVEDLCYGFPNWHHAQLMKVRILTDMGKLDEALKLVDAIIIEFPEYESAHVKRAMIKEDMGKLDDAVQAFWNTYTLFPSSTQAILGYVRSLMSIRDYARVEQCYTYLSSNNRLSKEIKLAYASYYGSRKWFEKADSLFDSILKEHPDYQDAWLKYAQYLPKAKGHEEAISTFENICSRFPFNPKMYLGHAKFWETMGDMTQAIRAYKILIAKFPEFQKGYLDYALYLATLPDKRKNADLMFREILTKYPDNYQAKIRYVQFISWQKTWAETEKEYNLLLTQYPYNQSLHAQYVDFLWFMREYDNAIKHLESSKTQFKYNQYLYRKHILMLIDDGKRAAIKQFKYATKKFPYNRKISKLSYKIESLQTQLALDAKNKKINHPNCHHSILHQFNHKSDGRKRKPEKQAYGVSKKLKM